MIVTTGARRRETEETTGHDVDAVVDDLMRKKIEARTYGEKAQRSHRLRGPAGQKVGRDLFTDKSIKWQVTVERFHHIIAISVGKRILRFPGINLALGIGVARHVQPMPPPAPPVLGRCQQSVDKSRQCLTGIGIAFKLKRPRLGKCRGQACQLDRRTPNQLP